MEYSISHTNQQLDVGGSHRYLFFTRYENLLRIKFR